jgi:hypothetical protein
MAHAMRWNVLPKRRSLLYASLSPGLTVPLQHIPEFAACCVHSRFIYLIEYLSRLADDVHAEVKCPQRDNVIVLQCFCLTNDNLIAIQESPIGAAKV